MGLASFPEQKRLGKPVKGGGAVAHAREALAPTPSGASVRPTTSLADRQEAGTLRLIVTDPVSRGDDATT